VKQSQPEQATPPEDPAELRVFTALLLAEVKAQAVLIEKLSTSWQADRRTDPSPTAWKTGTLLDHPTR